MNFIKRGINQDVFSIRNASLGLSPAGEFKSFRGGAKLLAASIGRAQKFLADGMSVGWYD
jgi:hypothetical protein